VSNLRQGKFDSCARLGARVLTRSTRANSIRKGERERRWVEARRISPGRRLSTSNIEQGEHPRKGRKKVRGRGDEQGGSRKEDGIYIKKLTQLAAAGNFELSTG